MSDTFIAAPSANLSGRPSPTNVDHVIHDLKGAVDMIIDGGSSTLGLESTIVDLSGEAPMILRPGSVTKLMLENVIGNIAYDPAILGKQTGKDYVPKAPGMKYRHYAPRGSLTIYDGAMDDVVKTINIKSEELIQKGHRVGVIATEESKKKYRVGNIKVIGTRKDESTIAANLYQILRTFDEEETEYIFSESFSDDELGQAIMNRLLKAAGYQVIKL